MRVRLLVVAALLAVAGCGGGSGDGGKDAAQTAETAGQGGAVATATVAPAAEAKPTSDALKAVAVQELADTLGQHPNIDVAYTRLSDRCRKAMTKSDYAGFMALGRGMVKADHIVVSVSVAGAKGTVAYHFTDGSNGDSTSPWVFERGGWYDDDCDTSTSTS